MSQPWLQGFTLYAQYVNLHLPNTFRSNSYPVINLILVKEADVQDKIIVSDELAEQVYLPFWNNVSFICDDSKDIFQINFTL